ncbi:hypothetical protein Hanom_Chr02g00160771 [Helianthus anomalus]
MYVNTDTGYDSDMRFGKFTRIIQPTRVLGFGMLGNPGRSRDEAPKRVMGVLYTAAAMKKTRSFFNACTV